MDEKAAIRRSLAYREAMTPTQPKVSAWTALQATVMLPLVVVLILASVAAFVVSILAL